ncbi:MAG: hypothetical protein ACLQDL_10655 [Spirochaetia bacterium]
MARISARRTFLVLFFALLVSCGDQSLVVSPKTTAADLQIVSASDGQVFASGKSVPLMVSATDTTKTRDVEIDVTLTNPAGQSISHSRTAAALNEQSPVTLPAGLDPGLYRLDLVLYSGGEVAQKKSVSFFVAADGWKITGIRSFPPVITSAATVMLKAELQVPDGSNPYLRWSWQGKPIQKGILSAGLGQILWDVPEKAGVYTVTLELFPIAPATGSDFSFTSAFALSTDIIVSANAQLPRGRLGPASSFSSLLRLQASLADSGAGARKTGKITAEPIGSPEVVSLDSGFGYRLDGSTGIRVPWLAIPFESGGLRPFTVSIGVTFSEISSANNIVAAAARDGSFSFVIAMNPQASAPRAQISGRAAAPLVIPWGGPAIPANVRVLLSLSVVPQSSGLSAQWFLDGVQVSSFSASSAPAGARQEGSITIGGENGFKGVVDEFGVYVQDAAGRPSTDPDLFARAQAAIYGKRVLIADGFDGIALTSGFSIEGRGRLAVGAVVLSPGARLALPPLRTGQSLSVTAGLSRSSARSADLLAQWEGSSAPAIVVPVTADAAGLGARISADGQSISVTSAEGEKTVTLPAPVARGASLLLKIENPAEARADLLIDSILAVGR